jgi:hypothetical protein
MFFKAFIEALKFGKPGAFFFIVKERRARRKQVKKVLKEAHRRRKLDKRFLTLS